VAWSRLGLFGSDLVSTWIIWIRLGLFGFDDFVAWTRRFLFGLDLDYLDSTIFALVSTWIIWIRLGLFGFDLDYLDSTCFVLLILTHSQHLPAVCKSALNNSGPAGIP
jgi:hypothetical protein